MQVPKAYLRQKECLLLLSRYIDKPAINHIPKPSQRITKDFLVVQAAKESPAPAAAGHRILRQAEFAGSIPDPSQNVYVFVIIYVYVRCAYVKQNKRSLATGEKKEGGNLPQDISKHPSRTDIHFVVPVPLLHM